MTGNSAPVAFNDKANLSIHVRLPSGGVRTTPENFEEMIFGGEVILRAPNIVSIRFDDEHHRMVIVTGPAHKPMENKRTACSVYLIAYTCKSLADLATSYEQKKAVGILSHWPVNHGMSTSMYYYDPYRNEFETQVDSVDTAEGARHAFLRTEEQKMNPTGVDFASEDFVK